MEIKAFDIGKIVLYSASFLEIWRLISVVILQKQEGDIKPSLLEMIIIYLMIQFFLTFLIARLRKIRIGKKGCTFSWPGYQKFVEWEELEQKSVVIGEDHKIHNLLLGVYANKYGDIMGNFHQFTYWLIVVSVFGFKKHTWGDYWGELAIRRDELAEVIEKYQIELKEVK